MRSLRTGAALVLALSLLALASVASAQGIANAVTSAYGPMDFQCADPTQGFGMSLGVRKYVNSFVSYEIPGQPGTTLSRNIEDRLECPWEQTLGVIKLGYTFKSFDVKFEAASTLSSVSGKKAKDSQWNDPDYPSQKTDLIEGKSNPNGWMLDLATTVPLCLTANCGMPTFKGVLGFRAQQMRFSWNKGVLTNILTPGVLASYPNTFFESSDTFKHFYIGGVASQSLNLSPWTCGYSSTQLMVRLQGDFGYVRANQSWDILLQQAQALGLLTPGSEFGRTTGTSWHVNLTTGLYASCRLRVDVEADFLRIQTNGDHEASRIGTVNTDFGWSGAKGWSDQAYIALSGNYAF